MTLAVISSAFLVYLNALNNGFVYDDEFQVVQNHWIRNIKYIPEIFSASAWKFQGIEGTNYYRPLLHLIYMVTYQVFGLKSWGFHLVNVLFHVGVSLLVFIIASKLLSEFQLSSSKSYLSVSFMAAALFATHPVHTEAVAWIGGLPDLSFTFFYLSSFYLYVRYREAAGTALLALSAVSFFLATLCKEPALTLPLVLIAYDYVFRHTGDRPVERFKRYTPFLVAGVGYLVLRLHALEGFAPQKQHMELSAYQLVINVFPLFAQYLGKVLVPVDLNVFHVLHPVSSILELKCVAALVVTTVFCTLTYVGLAKNKAAFFSLLFAVPLLPVLYIPGLGENTFAERYLYLPSVGFVVLLALFLEWIERGMPKGAMVTPIISMAIIGAYAFGTIDRNIVWRDNYTLFSDTVRKSPDGAVPRNNLGYALETRGRIDEAIEQYQFALKLKPDYAEASNNLGSAFHKKGWLQIAMDQYQTTLTMHPDYIRARINLGFVLEELGRFDEAIEQYQIILKRYPDSIDAHYSLGNALFKKGWIDQAIVQYQTALTLNPDNYDVHYNLGIAFEKKGMLDEAIEQFQIALELNPTDPEFASRLIKAYKMKRLTTGKDQLVR
jgi:Flp pilus assembly protein TadD